ncbi:MAG TPA: four helix bundle protein [Labilithrix sp.]|nr:four helix bundle protein [Labilithrix sp.]
MHTFRFSYRRLDAFHIAKEVLSRGHAIAQKFPRGYGPLADQLRRALASAYTQTVEGASREGADRRQRCRVARAECNEAAAAIEGAHAIWLISDAETNEVLVLLDRLAGMLTRLGGLSA